MADADALLRGPGATTALQEDACRCLGALALACDSIADAVLTFCESVYTNLSDLLPHVLHVRPSRHAHVFCTHNARTGP